MSHGTATPKLLLIAGLLAFLVLVAAGVLLFYSRPTIEYVHVDSVNGRPVSISAPAPGTNSSIRWFNPQATPLPATAFEGIAPSLTMGEVLARLGPAQADIGSGLYVLRWPVSDGRVFLVSVGGLEASAHPISVGFSNG
jgi:hypothetical protein